jgi:hypothetical protein
MFTRCVLYGLNSATALILAEGTFSPLLDQTPSTCLGSPSDWLRKRRRSPYFSMKPRNALRRPSSGVSSKPKWEPVVHPHAEIGPDGEPILPPGPLSAPLASSASLDKAQVSQSVPRRSSNSLSSLTLDPTSGATFPESEMNALATSLLDSNTRLVMDSMLEFFEQKAATLRATPVEVVQRLPIDFLVRRLLILAAELVRNGSNANGPGLVSRKASLRSTDPRLLEKAAQTSDALVTSKRGGRGGSELGSGIGRGRGSLGRTRKGWVGVDQEETEEEMYANLDSVSVMSERTPPEVAYLNRYGKSLPPDWEAGFLDQLYRDQQQAEAAARGAPPAEDGNAKPFRNPLAPKVKAPKVELAEKKGGRAHKPVERLHSSTGREEMAGPPLKGTLKSERPSNPFSVIPRDVQLLQVIGRDGVGRSVGHWAARHYCLPIVALHCRLWNCLDLLVDAEGSTMLHYAASIVDPCDAHHRAQSLAAVRLLLTAGCNPHLNNSRKETPASFALSLQRDDIIALFKTYDSAKAKGLHDESDRPEGILPSDPQIDFALTMADQAEIRERNSIVRAVSKLKQKLQQQMVGSEEVKAEVKMAAKQVVLQNADLRNKLKNLSDDNRKLDQQLLHEKRAHLETKRRLAQVEQQLRTLQRQGGDGRGPSVSAGKTKSTNDSSSMSNDSDLSSNSSKAKNTSQGGPAAGGGDGTSELIVPSTLTPSTSNSSSLRSSPRVAPAAVAARSAEPDRPQEPTQIQRSASGSQTPSEGEGFKNEDADDY